jgi:hypothetical protein
MKKNQFIILCFFSILIILISYNKKVTNLVVEQKENIKINPIQENKKENIELRIEPQFVEFLPIRDVKNLGIVLSDIESHMPAGHQYVDSDKVTWAHETTHGINSVIRNKYNSRRTIIKTATEYRNVVGGGRINAFYVLKNRAVVIEEPNVKINQIAPLIPPSLRGRSYNLYLVQQTRDWNDFPLYVFDEWVAYTNGAACHLDLKINDRSDSILSMFNFNVYSICVAMAVEKYDSDYDDKQFKKYLTWSLERSYEYLNNDQLSLNYLEKIKTCEDGKEFRSFCKNYFGEEWTKKILKF